jgi:hypothetical protein
MVVMKLHMEQVYDSITQKTRVSSDTVQKALSMAIEEAVKEFLNVSEIIVDLDDKTACATFRIPKDMEILEALTFDGNVDYHDPLGVVFDMASFPPKLVKRIRYFFQILLLEMKRNENFKFWQKQSRQIIQGVVLGRYHDYVEVELTKNIVGIMPKNQWVPGETGNYHPGKVISFYVLRVQRSPLQIFLSRSSISLPALLLKSLVPWNTFVCKKRFIGQKSCILTDCPLDNQLAEKRDEVSRELNGEVLEIRNFASAS